MGRTMSQDSQETFEVSELRNVFAAAALVGEIVRDGERLRAARDIAVDAFYQADAMIQAAGAVNSPAPTIEEIDLNHGNADYEALRTIAEILDGTEWTVDMLEAIAEVCKQRGLRVRDL